MLVFAQVQKLTGPLAAYLAEVFGRTSTELSDDELLKFVPLDVERATAE